MRCALQINNHLAPNKKVCAKDPKGRHFTRHIPGLTKRIASEQSCRLCIFYSPPLSDPPRSACGMVIKFHHDYRCGRRRGITTPPTQDWIVRACRNHRLHNSMDRDGRYSITLVRLCSGYNRVEEQLGSRVRIAGWLTQECVVLH